MDAQILYPTLAALCAVVALNLKLTMSALRAARKLHTPARPLTPGQQVPAVAAKRLSGRAPLQLAGGSQAWALLFLSSQCPKCREKLPDIDLLLDAAGDAGLAMWLVSEEPGWRLRRFLHGRRLLGRTAMVPRTDYQRLNPTKASPAYLFVNHEGGLEAGGIIGDSDWQALCSQLRQEGADRAQAA